LGTVGVKGTFAHALVAAFVAAGVAAAARTVGLACVAALTAALLWPADAHALLITEFPLPNALRYPAGIAASPDGALWFTEQGGNKIGRITT
jgi:streptogramin lyase